MGCTVGWGGLSENFKQIDRPTWLSDMCQWRTLIFAYTSESMIFRIASRVSKCRAVSIINPRCGNRGASSITHGAYMIWYVSVSKSKATSCENVSIPWSAPYTVAAVSVATPPASGIVSVYVSSVSSCGKSSAADVTEIFSPETPTPAVRLGAAACGKVSGV